MIRKSTVGYMKSGKETEKKKHHSTQFFKQIQFRRKRRRRRGESKVSQTERVVHSESKCSSHLREVLLLFQKIIGTEKISRNNNDTVT